MPSVLIIDSEPEFASEIEQGLIGRNCHVSIARDGKSGLAQASEHRPDLILLTAELPRMNGFSVCHRLRRDARLRDVPVIILSANASEETFSQHRRLERKRADAYVHKPVSFDELLPTIGQFVNVGEVPNIVSDAVSVFPPDAADGPSSGSDHTPLASGSNGAPTAASPLVPTASAIPSGHASILPAGMEASEDLEGLEEIAFDELEEVRDGDLPDIEVEIDDESNLDESLIEHAELEGDAPSLQDSLIAEPEFESGAPSLRDSLIAEPEFESGAPSLRDSLIAEPEFESGAPSSGDALSGEPEFDGQEAAFREAFASAPEIPSQPPQDGDWVANAEIQTSDPSLIVDSVVASERPPAAQNTSDDGESSSVPDEDEIVEAVLAEMPVSAPPAPSPQAPASTRTIPSTAAPALDPDLARQIGELNTKLEALRQKNAELVQQARGETTRAEALSAQLTTVEQQAEGTAAQLRKELATLKVALEEQEAQRNAEIAQLTSELNERDARWATAQHELEQLRRTQQDSGDAANQLKEDLLGARQTQLELEQQLESAQGALPQLQGALESAEREKQQLREELDATREGDAQLQSEVSTLREKQQQMENQLEHYRAESASTEVELQNARELQDQLEAQVQATREVQQRLSAEKVAKEEELHELDRQLQATQQSHEQLEARLQASEANLERAQTQVAQLCDLREADQHSLAELRDAAAALLKQIDDVIHRPLPSARPLAPSLQPSAHESGLPPDDPRG